jgi:OPA family sugar phosphate sensor protein UhpC-like MFS transporter
VEEKSGEREESSSAFKILFEHVLKNKFIWILAAAYFFVYVIRMSVDVWSFLFLVEQKNFSQIAAGACVFGFEIGGIFGSLAAGWASDKIFGGRRGPVNVLFCLTAILAIGAFWASPAGATALSSILIFIMGFLIFGPQMLIGMVAAELAGKKAAGSATGFVGLVAYIGAATAGYPLGVICEKFGWWGFFASVGVCGAISVLLLLPLWGLGGTQQKQVEAEDSGLEPSE